MLEKLTTWSGIAFRNGRNFMCGKIIGKNGEAEALRKAKYESDGDYASACQTVVFSGAEATNESNVNGIFSLFESISVEEGWMPGNDLRAHIAHSLYFGLHVAEGGLVGALQIVLPDEEGKIPLYKTWPDITPCCAMPPNGVAHIALLAIRKQSRRNECLYWQLCVAMWRWCAENGVTKLWAEITPRNLRIYRRLGWPFAVEGPLRSHWGEDCYPCRLNVHEVYKVIAARAKGNSSRYRKILADALADREAFVVLENAK